MVEPILLHGTLHVTIYNVKGLINTTGQGFTQLEQNNEEKVFGKGVTNLYVAIDLEKAQVGRTRIMRDQEHTSLGWNESFHIYCAHTASNVVFTVKDGNPSGTTLIRTAYVPVKDILDGKEMYGWVKILDEHKRPIHGDPEIQVKLQYFDVTKESNWDKGIGSPKFSGVPNTLFSQTEGCNVSLYQDAHHVPDNFVPKISLAGGQTYQPQRCWEDVFDAINDAKHLIYITGWSVYTEISLVRDPSKPKSGGDTTLGELLKKKADQGVTVLMLIWNDKTSVPSLKKKGFMATHHKETTRFFRHTRVHCVSCPRKPNDGGNSFKNSLIYTHHQKTLVVDSELPSGGSSKRRIVSFVGGLDLCDGRYDTQFHSLFRTLDTVHRDDFYQPNLPGSAITKGGPREPWHDIHARLEGPIAWDVLSNFEQRWRRQGKPNIPLRKLEDIIVPRSPVPFADDRESWNVQLFRSIDDGAASELPNTWKDATKVQLRSGKDNIIDRSIQDAYIDAIRRAKNFIYIESQFFLGSSFAWGDDDIKPEDIGSLHLIPKELSLKIVSKINAGDRFTVYVVVPMWPEGVPYSYSVQIILDGQRRTMEMMYKDVIQALNANGIVEDPRNYLTFFCLGNREVEKPGEYRPPKKPRRDSDYMRAQEARRYMIYVHSKMMIVDDEYIIVGSANINQRSMDGGRDSEIAMGAYQPYHINSCREPARGQIHGFRMSLWYEHLRTLEECFLHPERVDCVEIVNKRADKNWDLYSCGSLESDLPGHLLRYPVGISGDGTITELPGFEFFPDTKARVLGNLPAVFKRKYYFNDVFHFRRKLAKQVLPIFFFQP